MMSLQPSVAMADGVPSLLELCVRRLALDLIRCGPKRRASARLSELPLLAQEALLEALVAKNALHDNVLLELLTANIERLGLEGAYQLRRSVLASIGQGCPNLRALDVRRCQQVGNRLVRDVLQHCHFLESLRLDGCTRISDSAFAPAASGAAAVVQEVDMKQTLFDMGDSGPATWKALSNGQKSAQSALPGLLGLRELTLGECSQITTAGLQDYVATGAKSLRTLGLAFCRLAVTDDVVSNLLTDREVESIDLSFCSQVTDAPFRGSHALPRLRQIRLADAPVTDEAAEGLARRAAQLEVFDGWALKLTDRGVVALATACVRLRKLCVRSTAITNASFVAIAQCSALEHLDASWCLLATSQALAILAAPPAPGGRRPPLKELVLDHLGGVLPALPVPAAPGPPPSLRLLVGAYASRIEMLMLDGITNVVSADALLAVAEGCPGLRQLALAVPAGPDSECALKEALCKVGAGCQRLHLLRLNASARPHRAIVEALALPNFVRLRSLTLWCCGSAGGLQDSELELLLSGRTALESLTVRNSEGLTEGLFPRWCHRGPACDEEEVTEQLDQALLSACAFDGKSSGSVSSTEAPNSPAEAGGRGSLWDSWRPVARCPAAVALGSVVTLSLGGACELSDRSADALAELLHDAQTVEISGCPQLTGDAVRSLRKRCRFLSSVKIIAQRDRQLSWTAVASTLSKRHRQRSGFAKAAGHRASELATILERGYDGSSTENDS